jgi:hypothetical protein
VLLSKALRGASREGALSPRLFAAWFVVALTEIGDIQMNKTKALFGILTITLALVASAQAQFSYANNGDGSCTIIGYTGAGGAVTIPGTITGLTVTSIGESAFNDTRGLTSVTIPGSVTSIGEWAFSACGLSSITIPNGVTNIGDGAFAFCQLTNLTIPDSVPSIGQGTFEDNAKLTNVTIPGSVTSIGYEAFADCNLTNIYFTGNAPTADSTVFADNLNATVYYLPGTTGWSPFFAGLPAFMLNPPTPPALVQTTTSLNLVLTATYQLPALTNGNLVTSVTKSAQFTSASILKLIETSGGTNFQSGTYLAQEGGTVEALNHSSEVANLSFFIVISNNSSAAVVSGMTNIETGKQNGSGLVYTVVRFNDGKGNTFAVDGIMRQTVSVSAKSASGSQTESGVISTVVAGYGTVVDSEGRIDAAVFSGTISGSGKGPAGL